MVENRVVVVPKPKPVHESQSTKDFFESLKDDNFTMNKNQKKAGGAKVLHQNPAGMRNVDPAFMHYPSGQNPHNSKKEMELRKQQN